MRHLRFMLLVLPLLAGCGPLLTGAKSPAYPLDAVEVRDARRLDDGGAAFQYRTRAETLFYCPGAEANRRGDKVLLRLLRAPIENKGGAALEPEGPDAEGWLRLVVPDVGGRALLLDDGITTRELVAPVDPR